MHQTLAVDGGALHTEHKPALAKYYFVREPESVIGPISEFLDED